MVDIHSHFLYGLDDGSPDFETSVAMLRMAAEDGTTDIVATPHSDLNYQFEPQAVTSQLQELSLISDIPRLHRGCDFHLSFDNIQDCLEFPAKYSVNGKRYLLVEFHNQIIPAETDRIFESMLQLGITPVITHPERNPILSKLPTQVAHWVEAGCRVQITAQSILGQFGNAAQHASRELLNAGNVHFVASDAHDLKRRPPLLRPAFEEITREYDAGLAELLFVTNPAAVLTGDPVMSHIPVVTKPHRWFKLW